jgi:hypothetical protein
VIATVTEGPATFDRVDRVKAAMGQRTERHDHELWILGGPLRFTVDGVERWVPRGFTTDGSSLPVVGTRAGLVGPGAGARRWPVVIHDWLYTQPGVSKRYADHVLGALLSDRGAKSVGAVAVLACRLLGGPAWAAYQHTGPLIFDARPEPLVAAGPMASGGATPAPQEGHGGG